MKKFVGGVAGESVDAGNRCDSRVIEAGAYSGMRSRTAPGSPEQVPEAAVSMKKS